MSVPVDTRASIHIARQPILDANRQVFGYELLYREAALDSACTTEGDVAGSRVVTDALLGIGLDTLAPATLAFVNFTRPLLLSGAALLLPPRRVVIELREDVAVDQELMEACRDLQRQGYTFALDDFVVGSGAEALLPYAGFVKLDVLGTPGWKQAVRNLRAPNRRVIAERVERSDVALDAHRAGCSLFQGYYFCRPSTQSVRALPAHRQSYLNLFAALSQPDLTIASLEDLVKRDVSLTVRVLRSINSAAYALDQPVTSVRQALVLLGVQQVRQWAAVWAMAGLGAGTPAEIIATTLIRARMCETLGRARHGEEAAGELFLLGMCSTLDAILEVPIDRAIEPLPLSPRLRSALLGDLSEPRLLLDAVVARERGEWTTLAELLAKLKLSDAHLSSAYLDALQWTGELTSQTAAA